jgi:hypothetical protein
MSVVPLRRATSLLLALLLAAALVAAGPATPAEAAIDSTAEARFFDSVNAERARRGLSRLRVARDLTSVARDHSVRMADRNHLHHNPDLTRVVSGWQRISENVGRGPSVASLHRALMDSTGHRANILDSRVSEVGIGVEVRGSTVWVTQVFRLPSSTTSVSFSDVSSSSSHAHAITRIANSGVTMGCGTRRYCPERQVSRAEMATFLARSRALLPVNSTTFRDAPATPSHAFNIQAISNAGITTGCSSTQYCPTRSVTRAEMATFLMRARGLQPRTGDRFSDVRSGSTHAGAINAIADAGITVGCGNGRYCPDRPVTRAEMATFLVRAFGL